MKTLALVFLIGCAYGDMPGIWLDNADHSPRIVNGKDAKEGEFPFVVSIRRKSDSRHECGGTILTKDWVLTSAHCCTRVPAKDMTVYVGSVYLEVGSSGHPGDRTIIHEDYDPDNLWRNDMCLIRVKTQFAFGDNVQQVTLPTEKYRIPSGTKLTVIGWGITKPTTAPIPPPNTLQKADTFVALSNEECYDETGTDMTPGYLCARGGVKGQGICNGDSGSPILKDNVQVGVSSWVYLPCGGGHPDFFSRVPFYVNWLKKKLGPDANQLKFIK